MLFAAIRAESGAGMDDRQGLGRARHGLQAAEVDGGTHGTHQRQRQGVEGVLRFVSTDKNTAARKMGQPGVS